MGDEPDALVLGVVEKEVDLAVAVARYEQARSRAEQREPAIRGEAHELGETPADRQGIDRVADKIDHGNSPLIGISNMEKFGTALTSTPSVAEA